MITWATGTYVLLIKYRARQGEVAFKQHTQQQVPRDAHPPKTRQQASGKGETNFDLKSPSPFLRLQHLFTLLFLRPVVEAQISTRKLCARSSHEYIGDTLFRYKKGKTRRKARKDASMF